MLSLPTHHRANTQRVLHAYLLGRVGFDELLNLQQRMLFEVSGDRSTGVLILCEHPPGISIGRQGSASHILLEFDELRALGWPIRWVNRGGGCLLHLPGQVACYPIMALDALGLNVQEYLDRLHGLIRDVLRGCDVPAELRSHAVRGNETEPGNETERRNETDEVDSEAKQPRSHALCGNAIGNSPRGNAGIWVGARRIAHVGVAVRDWVSYFGCTVNVDPSLKPFRRVLCDGDARPMTSLERERRGRARSSTVRQRLLEAFAQRFGFDRVSVFHHHTSLPRKARVHAVATPAR